MVMEDRADRGDRDLHARDVSTPARVGCGAALPGAPLLGGRGQRVGIYSGAVWDCSLARTRARLDSPAIRHSHPRYYALADWRRGTAGTDARRPETGVAGG